MNRNQKELNIKKLLDNYSIETTPNVYNKYGKFSDLVPLNCSIYITYLPDESNIKVIETAKAMKKRRGVNFTSVDHDRLQDVFQKTASFRN